MKIGDDVVSRAINPIVSDLEEIYKRRIDANATDPLAQTAESAMEKLEEAINSTAKSTFDMMDRHNEMVKKSQELQKAQAKKRALERLTQKREEEHRELMAEMAIRNAERHDLLEAARLKKQ